MNDSWGFLERILENFGGISWMSFLTFVSIFRKFYSVIVSHVTQARTKFNE